MKRKWKIIIATTAIILLLGFMLVENIKGLEATVVEVQPSTIYKSFSEDGNIMAGLEQPIHAILGGEIVEVMSEEGQTVRQGDKLILINSKELNFQLRQVQAQLKSVLGEESIARNEPYGAKIKDQEIQLELAEKNLQVAEDNFIRIKRLFEEGAITKKNYEEEENILIAARVNYQQQRHALQFLYETHSATGGTNQFYQGRIEALRAQIDLLEYQIDRTIIRSPLDGIVANLSVKVGDLAGPALPLVTIFQDEFYSIETYILAENVYGIQKDMKVQLVQKTNSKENVFEGTIVNIAPNATAKTSALGLEEQRVKIIIRPVMPESAVLLPGSKVDVKFITQRQEDVLAVPRTVLFPYENKKALWVVENGKAKIKTVVTGFESDREVVISEGLNAGDMVILNPQLEGIKEGKRILTNH